MNHARFSTRAQIRFRDCDPAGILFFARAFELAHDTFEDFVVHMGFEWKTWFQNPEWVVPLRQTSCEHLRPMLAGEDIDIAVEVLKIGETSFTLRHHFSGAGTPRAEVTMVHVFVDPRTGRKTTPPLEIRERLEAYQSQSLTP